MIKKLLRTKQVNVECCDQCEKPVGKRKVRVTEMKLTTNSRGYRRWTTASSKKFCWSCGKVSLD